jgi:hypothetical protein
MTSTPTDGIMEDRFLHLYLTDIPEEAEIQTLLEFYGFDLEHTVPSDKDEPNEYHWKWCHRPLSGGAGVSLVYHDRLFSDDLYGGRYGTFVVLEGTADSSSIDLSVMDIVSKFLIDRYGGTIRNPNHQDAPTYLCGRELTESHT